jgi:hypothetical protein
MRVREGVLLRTAEDFLAQRSKHFPARQFLASHAGLVSTLQQCGSTHVDTDGRLVWGVRVGVRREAALHAVQSAWPAGNTSAP